MIEQTKEIPIIYCSLDLNVNFTPYLVESITSEIIENCLNRDSLEMSQGLIGLISRGLPDEEDKRVLLSFVSTVLDETKQLIISETESCVFRINLNNEGYLTLKFAKNYAPFMGGEWQRT